MPLLPGICPSPAIHFPSVKPGYHLLQEAHLTTPLLLWRPFLDLPKYPVHILFRMLLYSHPFVCISPTRVWAPQGGDGLLTHPAFARGMSCPFCVCFEAQPCCHIYSLDTNKHLSNTELCGQCIQHEGKEIETMGLIRGNSIRLARA